MNRTLQITGLFTHPIKSCAAVGHHRVRLDAFGLSWDRHWMLVDAAGVFVSQRSVPALAVVAPCVMEAQLQVTAPGFPPLSVPLQNDRSIRRSVTVWSDRVTAWDEGSAAAEWFSDFAGVELRLVRFPNDAVRPVDRRYSTRPDGRTAFSDGFPLLLASEESLEELNRRLVARGRLPVLMSRFRPNVVVGGADRPFAEDDWLSVRTDDLKLDLVKPCARCVMTTTDQQTGLIPEAGEPLATLSTFRRWGSHVAFAQNGVAHGSGEWVVGAALIVEPGVPNRWQIGPPKSIDATV